MLGVPVDKNYQKNYMTNAQITEVIDPQQSEPLHVQARNQHINKIKQLIALHEELITRLHKHRYNRIENVNRPSSTDQIPV